MNKYISREDQLLLSVVDEFYTALMKKMTGQVINGVLVGCLLESELKEVYEQFKQSEVDKEGKCED